MRKGKRVLKRTGSGSTNYNEFTYMPHYSEWYYPTALLEIPLPRFKNGHPTQKPVALCEYLIKTYTNEGETVLDNCMGSGTTGVACKELHRHCILCENNQDYVDIICNRIGKDIEFMQL